MNDFETGVCVGYLLGNKANSGGDVPSGNIPIYSDVKIVKQWNLSGTPFAIALFDVHSERLICGTKGEKILSATDNWDRLVVYYWIAIGLVYNGNVVTVAAHDITAEVLALNGTPYAYAYTEEIQNVDGTAEFTHSNKTLSSGDVEHMFSVTVAPTANVLKKTYRQNEVKSETINTRSFGSFTALSWELLVHPDGTKGLSYYYPDKLFIPVSSMGVLGMPKGTSIQQVLKTGLLFDTLKESLLNIGENATLEEVTL